MKLEDYIHDAKGCVRCSNCKFIDHIWVQSARFARQCPINMKYKFNLYSASGLLHSAVGIMENELEFTPRLLDALYKCTLCGACDIRCKRNLDLEVLSVIETLKARCVEVGKGPMLEHKVVKENIETYNNQYGFPHMNRLSWLTSDVRSVSKVDMLYFVGCTGSYIDNDIAQAASKILTHTNTEFMVSPDEWCCGYLLYSTGQLEAFKRQVEHNIRMVKELGVSSILVTCAQCYKTWKVDYPKVLGKSTDDMNFKVVHIVEYLAELIKEGKLSFKNRIDMKVTYHDPCNLARLAEPWFQWQGEHRRMGVLEPPKTFRRGDGGVYQQPRYILTSIPGIEFREMERARDNALCCGGGAGVSLSFSDFALWIASERLEEAKATGAEAIVTACPTGKRILSEAARQGKGNIKVYDINELILKAIL